MHYIAVITKDFLLCVGWVHGETFWGESESSFVNQFDLRPPIEWLVQNTRLSNGLWVNLHQFVVYFFVFLYFYSPIEIYFIPASRLNVFSSLITHVVKSFKIVVPAKWSQRFLWGVFNINVFLFFLYCKLLLLRTLLTVFD